MYLQQYRSIAMNLNYWRYKINYKKMTQSGDYWS